MNVSRSLVALAGGLLLAGGALAADVSKGNLHLYESVNVDGKQITPGTYKVEWNGTGPDVQVSILSGKNTIATVPAKVVAKNTKNESDGYVAAKQPDGSNDLSDIFFRGQKFELQVTQHSAGAGSQGSASGTK